MRHATITGKVVAAVEICLLSHTDKEDFSRRSRRAPPLNASHDVGRQKPDTLNDPTREAPNSAVSLPVGWAPELQSLDLWRNLQLRASSSVVIALR